MACAKTLLPSAGIQSQLILNGKEELFILWGRVGEKDGIASMHTNELPLRHLIIDLDSPTQSDNAFVGTIGKLVTIETKLYLNDIIPSININIGLIELEDDFVKNLSDEQKYLYQITRGIQAGSFPDYLRKRGT